MNSTFFSKPRLWKLPTALWILMVVFFVVPFAMRGARDALERLENNVTDWLPSSFDETTQLGWFAEHFAGEQFALVTWDGCNEDDQSYKLFLEKLRAEIYQPPLTEAEKESLSPHELELRRARELGDALGLYYVSNADHKNWGTKDEKWLRDDDGVWYFIEPDGSLYRWYGRSNVVSFAQVTFRRNVLGNKDEKGEFVDRFRDLRDKKGSSNPFYADPRRVTARYFSSVMTGPEIAKELSQPGGALRNRELRGSPKVKELAARKEAMLRLSGSLFGPAVPEDFDWTPDSIYAQLDETRRMQLKEDWREKCQATIDSVVKKNFNDDLRELKAATNSTQEQVWNFIYGRLGIEPPARQTCIMVTLSDAGKQDLGRVLGRGLMGKPRGRLVELALESGVAPPPMPPLTPFGAEPSDPPRVLRMGGPPVDNVAIDEEGQITLFRLIGLCIVIGLGLSFICLRSFKLTIMVFFVGGISAVTSLALVRFVGGTLDAILMSMPSLVYVLGLSGAIHIVNYYRDANIEHGIEGAPERAVAHGWWPCTIAAFTTSLGLLSLCMADIVPISKFGFYSALGVIATLVLLFTYLPSALELWPTKIDRTNTSEHDGIIVRFWDAIGAWIVKRATLVATVCTIVLIVAAFGVAKIETSVQLLKLFDPNAKIIRDYRWLEANFGKLVPMEVVVRVPPKLQVKQGDDGDSSSQLTFMERIELTTRVQGSIEGVFGESGEQIVGKAVSSATFSWPKIGRRDDIRDYRFRSTINGKLDASRDRLLAEDYLAQEEDKTELWRISLRLGALNNVDYGLFVGHIRHAVEPVLGAYELRRHVLRRVEAEGLDQTSAQVLLLARASKERKPATLETAQDELKGENPYNIDRAAILSSEFAYFMGVRGFRSRPGLPRVIRIHDGKTRVLKDLKAEIENADLVVVADESLVPPGVEIVHAKRIDADEFVNLTRTATIDDPLTTPNEIDVVYTGVVPIVFKAQRTLLYSLMDSIGWAFVMICLVMMLLLRYARYSLGGMLNVGGGLVSMIPNVFPVMLIFGLMGHWQFNVDIGSMMTASVAMGVAVDDTIHFLAWFRSGMENGMPRHDAIRYAYKRVAAAMTQTTLIGGLGLSVFAFSTFTPTQKFGILMLTLLSAALIGDLILLPAILAGPLGKLFEPRRKLQTATDSQSEPVQEESSGVKAPYHRQKDGAVHRTDVGHKRRDPG